MTTLTKTTNGESCRHFPTMKSAKDFFGTGEENAFCHRCFSFITRSFWEDDERGTSFSNWKAI